MIFQMHRNVTVSAAENTDPEFIANDAAKGAKATPIVARIAADAKSYTVSIVGGKSKEFETRTK